MENVPPSYDAAVARNPWGLIAPYIPSAELCALSRVSRELYTVFAPCLWGNPASHFGRENDRVYVALTRFKRTLKRVRLSVRELTHTLHLPPAQSELYDGPHPEWLRDVLEQLPNLQSLIVSHLPFFDHMALLALRRRSDGRRLSVGSEAPPTFALRLLIASHCQNTTPQGLAEALGHFPHLAYLDLSSTSAARDQIVLAKLGVLPQLQVLKLRNVHLRDEGVAYLADAIGIRVRSLDISSNDLTDESIKSLLTSCFDTAQEGGNGSRSNVHRNAINMPVEDWPAGFVRPDPAVLDEFKDESYDERFVRRLTSKVVSRLPFEDLPQSGITHLHISDNQVSVEGLGALVRSGKLHVLDAGSVNTKKAVDPLFKDSLSPPSKSGDEDPNFSGIERLTPVLTRCGRLLTSLRIDFTLITTKGPAVEEPAPIAVCELATTGHQGPRELTTSNRQIAELDNTEPPIYQLDSLEVAPAYELPSEPVNGPSLTASASRKLSVLEQERNEMRRGSAFAPEVADCQDVTVDAEQTLVLTATGLSPMAQAANGVGNAALSPVGHASASLAGLSAGGDPRLSLALIEQHRKDLHIVQKNSPSCLMPHMLPKLRTITLTNVPCYEPDRAAVDALVAFIKSCASEASLALNEARLLSSIMGRMNQSHSRTDHLQTSRDIFPLQRIILEMSPASRRQPFTPERPPYSTNPINRTLSSTEDADSEAFMSASNNDFTFFDDQEECGLPATENGTFTPTPLSSLPEKIAVSTDDDDDRGSADPALSQQRALYHHQRQHHYHHHHHPNYRHPPPGELPGEERRPIDVIAELAAFRKETKAAFENALATGGVGHVEGYWPGEVKVVREQRLGPGGGGKVDYYGNYFEKGVYR